MAAVVEVVLAELLHQLEVVQAVSQRHGLLEADICAARGGVGRTQGWEGRQEGRGEIRQGLCLKRGRRREINILLPVAFMQFTVADFDQTQSVFRLS